MGWYWGLETRADQIREFRELKEGYREVAGCYRGSPWKGKYWQVIECPDGERFLMLFLMEYDRHTAEWGYKPIEESMGPCYYDCPLSYLKLATSGIDEQWRMHVKNYAALASTRRKASLARTRARKVA